MEKERRELIVIMEKVRGFEVISKYENEGINLPVRATMNAAGYDFEAAEDVVIPSFIKLIADQGVTSVKHALKWLGSEHDEREQLEMAKKIKPVLVPTGIKSYMKDDEYLQLANRSSNPLKRFLLLANGIGVIDSDYYNNVDNEGHIMFQFVNFGLKDVHIKKGERIGQGTFIQFLKADDDYSEVKRVGGFGSSDEI